MKSYTFLEQELEMIAWFHLKPPKEQLQERGITVDGSIAEASLGKFLFPSLSTEKGELTDTDQSCNVCEWDWELTPGTRDRKLADVYQKAIICADKSARDLSEFFPGIKITRMCIRVKDFPLKGMYWE